MIFFGRIQPSYLGDGLLEIPIVMVCFWKIFCRNQVLLQIIDYRRKEI